MTVEHDALGDFFFVSNARLDFAHAHGGGGEVQNDLLAAPRRNAKRHWIGAGDWFHAAVESRHRRAHASGGHADHALVGGHFHVVGEPSGVTGAAEANDA